MQFVKAAADFRRSRYKEIIKASTHIGAPGDPLRLQSYAIVDNIAPFTNRNGIRGEVVRITTILRDMITWFRYYKPNGDRADGEPDVNIGDRIRFKAEIKRHEDNQYGKQTTIHRVKVTDLVTPSDTFESPAETSFDKLLSWGKDHVDLIHADGKQWNIPDLQLKLMFEDVFVYTNLLFIREPEFLTSVMFTPSQTGLKNMMSLMKSDMVSDNFRKVGVNRYIYVKLVPEFSEIVKRIPDLRYHCIYHPYTEQYLISDHVKELWSKGDFDNIEPLYRDQEFEEILPRKF